jgi:hypothetical protein
MYIIFSFSNSFPKSELGFEKWTKKMSKNQNLEKVLKKMCLKSDSDHNDVNYFLRVRKVVMIIFS